MPASSATRGHAATLEEAKVTRLIVEEALAGEATDAVGREYYDHGAQPGQGYRNGYRAGRLKTAEGRSDRNLLMRKQYIA